MKKYLILPLVLLLASCAKTEPTPETTPGGQVPQRDDNSYGEHGDWTDDSTNSFWSKSSSIIQNTNID